MGTNFSKIVQKQLYGKMQGAKQSELDESDEKAQAKIASLEEVVFHQEKIISQLYAELNKKNEDLEMREKLCREKEEKLERAFAKFASTKEKVAEVMLEAKEEVLAMQARYQEVLEKLAEREKIIESFQKKLEQSQNLEKRFQQAQERIQYLESLLENQIACEEGHAVPYKTKTMTSMEENKTKLDSRKWNVPMGFTPSSGKNEEIYLHTDSAISKTHESQFRAIQERLELLSAEYLAIKQHLEEVSKGRSQSSSETLAKKKNRVTSSTSSKEIRTSSEELQYFLDSYNQSI